MNTDTTRTIRLGTRGSALALWQARHVAALLDELPERPRVEIVTIRTTGDEVTDVPLWQVEGKAFFTRELDDALIGGRIDLAVHSLKDLATSLPAGLVLAAVPPREDPRDALVTRSGAGELASLPAGARIGTSSVRRRAFLRHHHPALVPAELRGNVPTRVAQVVDGHYDAIILAAAGLKRLGLEARIAAYLDPQQFPPAAAQGALGLCTRRDDAELRSLVEALEDPAARLETSAERAFLARLEAGCQVPAGVLARLQGTRLRLHGVLCETDGSQWRRAELDCPAADPTGGGLALADRLRQWRASA
jgi:hydroxymethylbilane synthase